MADTVRTQLKFVLRSFVTLLTPGPFSPAGPVGPGSPRSPWLWTWKEKEV